MGIGNFFKAASPISWLNRAANPRNPMEQAEPFMQQAEQRTREGYQPYISQGRVVDPILQQQYQRMLQDPQGLYSQIAQGYQESPFSKFKKQESLAAAQNAAAAGGYAGTDVDQKQQMELADVLSSGDMQNFINTILGIQGQGMAGFENISGRGYDASSKMADTLGSISMGRAGGEAGHVQQRTASRNALLNALIKGGAAAMGAANTGDVSAGGGGGGLSRFFKWGG